MIIKSYPENQNLIYIWWHILTFFSTYNLEMNEALYFQQQKRIKLLLTCECVFRNDAYWCLPFSPPFLFLFSFSIEYGYWFSVKETSSSEQKLCIISPAVEIGNIRWRINIMVFYSISYSDLILIKWIDDITNKMILLHNKKNQLNTLCIVHYPNMWFIRFAPLAIDTYHIHFHNFATCRTIQIIGRKETHNHTLAQLIKVTI